MYFKFAFVLNAMKQALELLYLTRVTLINLEKSQIPVRGLKRRENTLESQSDPYSSPGLMNQCRGFLGLGTNVVFPVVGTYVEVWGVAQRRRCLRGMLSLHAEMLVSPNNTNEAV